MHPSRVAGLASLCGRLFTIGETSGKVTKEIVSECRADACQKRGVYAGPLEYLVGIGAVAAYVGGQPGWCAFLAPELLGDKLADV